MATTEDFINAVKAGEVAQVQALLDSQPDLISARTADGTSALLLGVYYGHRAVVQALLARQPELDIFAAAAVGDATRITALLQSDPQQVNAYAPDGFHPLGLAAFFGHEEAVGALLAGGAAVNQAANNSQRVMALHSAVANQHLAIARLLLAHGAEVNATQEDAFTPLHEAAQNGQLPMAELLLSAGATVNPQLPDGKTPLALAREFQHPTVAALLEAHGGTV